MRSFFKFLILEKIISQNPTDLLENPKLEKITRILTIEEIDLMVNQMIVQI